MPSADVDETRAELRRLWLAATQGRWRADSLSTGQHHVFAVQRDGGLVLVAAPNRAADAALVAAMHEALPVLFRALDAVRGRRAIPVLGEVLDGGRIAWRAPAAGA